MDTQPDITFYSIIMLVGAAHGFFLAFVLINSPKSVLAGRVFLSILTLAFAIDLGHEFLYQSRYLLNFISLAFVDPVINLFYGPAFYLYAKAVTKGVSFHYAKETWLHLLPICIGAIITLGVPQIEPSQFASLYYDDNAPKTPNELLVQQQIGAIALSSVFSLGLYIIISIKLLNQHAKLIRQQFSSVEKLTLNWLRGLLIALSALYLILILDGFFSESLGLDDTVNRILYIAVFCIIYSMGYLGIRQPAIFINRGQVSLMASLQEQTEAPDNEEQDAETKTKSKYEKSALDAELSATLSEDLKSYMESEKPYLESQITLSQLAEQLRLSPNYLSQVINEQFNMNFFDFVNGYRIDEAKTILQNTSNKKINMLDVIYQSGFNSKSAFYAAFKKQVGKTPSEFKKQLEDS